MCQGESDLDYDYETKVWSESKVSKTRKVFFCSGCGIEIPVGSFRLKHFSVADGRPFSRSLCQPCSDLRDRFSAAHGNILLPPEILWSEVQHCVAEEPDSKELWQQDLDGIKQRNEQRRAQRLQQGHNP